MSHRRASDLSAAERAEILRHSEVGADLPEETLWLLAEGSEAVDYRRRRFIYRTSDTADALYCIARGRVKICSIDSVTAREAVIDIVGAGANYLAGATDPNIGPRVALGNTLTSLDRSCKEFLDSAI